MIKQTKSAPAWTLRDTAEGSRAPAHISIIAQVKDGQSARSLEEFEALTGIEAFDMPAATHRMFREAWQRPEAPAPIVMFNAPAAQIDAVQKHFDILGTGPRVSLPGAAPLARSAGTDNPSVIGAIIDDGVPYLSPIFQAGADASKTRLMSVWLQGSEPGQGVMLDSTDIEAMLAQGTPEQLYRAVGQRHLSGTTRNAIEQRNCHGAAVAELAFAPGPGDAEAMANIPVLAVQLPPRAIIDSSGEATSAQVLAGLVWIMGEAIDHALTHGVPFSDLVVNLSVGALAGPDGAGEYALILDLLSQMYAGITGKALHLVCAYGNAYRDRLVVRRAGAFDVDWRVLPEDQSESSVELRSDDSAATTLRITHPGLPEVVFAPHHTLAELQVDGDTIARIERRSDPWDSRVVITIAPTSRRGDAETPLAPAGRWAIGITGPDQSVAVLKIRRDDTPGGYRVFGRQSYFDHPDAHGWDAETGRFDDPAGSPITGLGTAASHVGVASATTYFVGARVRSTGAAAPYSSSGLGPDATGNLAGPWTSEEADQSRVQTGLPVTPVLGRGGARLSGTSAAAPLLTRKILLNGVPPVDDYGPRHPRLGWDQIGYSATAAAQVSDSSGTSAEADDVTVS